MYIHCTVKSLNLSLPACTRLLHRRRCGTSIRPPCSCRCWSFPSSTCRAMTRWVWSSNSNKSTHTNLKDTRGRVTWHPAVQLMARRWQHLTGRYLKCCDAALRRASQHKPGLDVVRGGKCLSVLDCNLFSGARYHENHTHWQQQRRIGGVEPIHLQPNVTLWLFFLCVCFCRG